MRGRAVLAAVALAAMAVVASRPDVRAGDVHIGVNIGGPPVVVAAPPPAPPAFVVLPSPPPLAVVPHTPVAYAPGIPYDYFYYDGRYFTFHAGSWYYASSYNGPWTYVTVGYVPRPVLAVPVAYYKMPPGHWKKHGPPPWAGRGKHGHKHDDYDD